MLRGKVSVELCPSLAGRGEERRRRYRRLTGTCEVGAAGRVGVDSTGGALAAPLSTPSPAAAGTRTFSLHLSGLEHISMMRSEGPWRTLEEPGNLDSNCAYALVSLIK